MRHLISCSPYLRGLPKVIAEFGPGDSLGTGIAALLCGAQIYYALDLLDHTQLSRDLVMLDRLAELIQRRAPVPSPNEFPKLQPMLQSYDFPYPLIAESEQSHFRQRIEELRVDLAHRSQLSVKFIAPWNSQIGDLPNGTADLVVAQATMQYIHDLDATYKVLRSCLKDGGILSLQIDFSAHETGQRWFDHWIYSDKVWDLINKTKPYRLSRHPLNMHVRTLSASGFKILEKNTVQDSPIPTYLLSERFKDLSEEDRCTRAAHLIVQREG